MNSHPHQKIALMVETAVIVAAFAGFIALPIKAPRAESPQIALGAFEDSQVASDYLNEGLKAATSSVAAKTMVWGAPQTVSVSAYSLKESCHNKKSGVCIAANGEAPFEGITVACPRSVPLGTRVRITFDTGTDWVYFCEDRTAKWIEEKYGPTIDIFMNDHTKALEFGRQNLKINYET